MPALTRPAAFTVLQAALLDQYADEIERVVLAVFGNSLTKTAAPLTKVRRTSNQSVPSATYTTITWQQAVRDTDVMWDSGTPDRITVVTAGTWLLLCCPRFSATAGQKRIYLTKNGTDITTNTIGITDAGAGASIIQVVLVDVLAAGDQIYARAYQDSGSTQNLQTDVGGTYLIAFWLGP